MMNNRPDDFEDINNTAEVNVSHTETAENDFVDIGSYSAPERKKYDTAELPPKLSSVSYDEDISATADRINGVSYKKLKKSRTRHIMFNNNEPMPIAVRKIFSQLFVILFVICAVFALLVGKSFITDRLTDDSYFSLSMSSSYGEPVDIGIPDFSTDDSPYSSPGFACLSAAAGKLGTEITESELYALTGNSYSARLANGMAETAEMALPGYGVILKENQSNYDMLIDIYDSLKNGLPVIIKYYGENGDDERVYTWGIVSSIDFGKDSIVVKNPYGVTDKLTADLFIDATRARDVSALMMKTEFVLGIQNKNTTIFFTKDNG